jgi:hypothetical protein
MFMVYDLNFFTLRYLFYIFVTDKFAEIYMFRKGDRVLINAII